MTKVDSQYSYEDYSSIRMSNDAVKIPFYTKRDVYLNLGIYRTVKGEIRTDKYCGYTWLKDMNDNIVCEEGEPVVLHIKPRFDLDLNTMLQKISGDDEFFEYLALETDDPMIRFFYSEPMITNVAVQDNMNQLIAVLSFISLLEKRTRISVIKRIIPVEKNEVGKLRGHIQMNKQISKNLSCGHAERIYSSYNERSEDNTENRILLYALRKAEEYLEQMGTGIDEKILRMLAMIKNRLVRVNGADVTSYSAKDIDKVMQKLPNIYRNYVPVFEYAKLILLETATSAGGTDNSIRIIPYAINSHMLYECYARACIKEIIQEMSTDVLTIEMLKYVKDKDNIPSNPEYGVKDVIKGMENNCYIAGKIVPDIVLKYAASTPNAGANQDMDVYYRVYDVKYKSANPTRGRDDRLQLLAYNLLYSVNNNTGFIMPNATNTHKELNLTNAQTEMYGCELGLGTDANRNDYNYMRLVLG